MPPETMMHGCSTLEYTKTDYAGKPYNPVGFIGASEDHSYGVMERVGCRGYLSALHGSIPNGAQARSTSCSARADARARAARAHLLCGARGSVRRLVLRSGRGPR